MGSKKVSVIIPAYNVENFIRLTIQSVLEQAYADWELIIVNDGSTDGTLQACRSFQDPRIRIIDRPHHGVSQARNIGILNSQGEYVAFLDADDIWFPGKLEKQVSFLECHPLVGLVFCGACLIDKDGVCLGIKQEAKVGDIGLLDVFLLNPVKNCSVPVVRRAALDAARALFPSAGDAGKGAYYFDPQLSGPEDLDCWLRIILTNVWQIRGIPDCLVYYRINPAGLSLSLDKYHASWLLVRQKVKLIHPEFFAKYARLAEAFQYRYLTQRAILAGAGKAKVLRLSIMAITTDLSIFIKDTPVTFITLAAVWSYVLLPRRIFLKSAYWMSQKIHLLKEKAFDLYFLAISMIYVGWRAHIILQRQ